MFMAIVSSGPAGGGIASRLDEPGWARVPGGAEEEGKRRGRGEEEGKRGG